MARAETTTELANQCYASGGAWNFGNSTCDYPNPLSAGAVCLSDAECKSGLVCSKNDGSEGQCVIDGSTAPVITGSPNLKQKNTPGVSETPNLKPNSSWCNDDPNLVYSNGICLPASSGNTEGIAGSASLPDLLIKIVSYLLYLAGVVAVVALIIGGFWYITSAGNTETAEKGQKALTNAIIGLILIILSFAIVRVISSTLTTDPKSLLNNTPSR